MAVRPMIVAQFGLAMSPLLHLTSSGLTSGITSGTSGSSRKALELSTTVTPSLAASGRNFLATSLSAAPKRRSSPFMRSRLASSTSYSLPLKASFEPALRELPKRRSSATGKLRSASTIIICSPTAPVAPRMPTLSALGSVMMEFLWVCLNSVHRGSFKKRVLPLEGEAAAGRQPASLGAACAAKLIS